MASYTPSVIIGTRIMASIVVMMMVCMSVSVGGWSVYQSALPRAAS